MPKINQLQSTINRKQHETRDVLGTVSLDGSTLPSMVLDNIIKAGSVHSFGSEQLYPPVANIQRGLDSREIVENIPQVRLAKRPILTLYDHLQIAYLSRALCKRTVDCADVV